MGNPWILCGVGFLFCVAGVYSFYRTAFEENKRILKPVLLMVAGVILIGIGSARYFNISL